MNRIRDLREDRDLKQSDVAKAIGIDQKTLSNYETGKTNPDSFAIIKLADFFNVSADYLIGRSSDSQAEVEDIDKRLDKIQSEIDKIRTEIRKL